jgi:hypothetical protein
MSIKVKLDTIVKSKSAKAGEQHVVYLQLVDGESKKVLETHAIPYSDGDPAAFKARVRSIILKQKEKASGENEIRKRISALLNDAEKEAG